MAGVLDLFKPAQDAGKAVATGAPTQAVQAVPPATPTPWANDPMYDQAVNTINKNIAGLGSTRDLSVQRTNEDYTKATDDASKQSAINLKALQNRLANQGIGYSGINIEEQGKLGEALQNQLATLGTNKQRGLEDIARDYADKQAGYQDQLGAAEADRAARETERQKTEAADIAAAKAAKDTADLQRQWIGDITTKLTALTQPTPTPTGQMALAPSNPQALVQKALAAVPPPAAKTPQQQIQDSGVDPKLVQSTLDAIGFSPGPVDGIIGIKTQRAIAAVKQQLGLPATADMTPEIWAKIQAYALSGNQPHPGKRGMM